MRILSAISALAVASLTIASVVKRDAPNNSGTIPGTGITVYGLIDTRTGEPVDLNEFSKTFIGLPVDTTEAPAKRSLKRSLLEKRGTGFDEMEYVRRWCIPQVSVNREANPYHTDLTGGRVTNYFTGTGRPVVYPGSGTDCRLSAQDCPISLSKEITMSNAIVMTITDGESNTVTGTLGGSQSVTNSSSVSDTLAKTVENNWSHTDSKTEDYSLAKTTGEIGTKGGSKNTNNVRIDTHGSEDGSSDTNGTDDTDSEANEKHVGGGLNLFDIIKVDGGGSQTKTKSHTKSESHTNNKNTNKQDGWNNSTMVEDNWSTQTQNLQTETTGHSSTSSDTTGGSTSETNSRMKTRGTDISASKDWSNSTAIGKDHTVTQGNTTTTSNTAGLTRGWSVPRGMCMHLACFPDAEMLVMPYLCADTEEQTVERIAVALSKFTTEQQQMNCDRVGLITCQDAQRKSMPFVTYDETYLSISSKNTLRMTGFITDGKPLVSNNGEFTAGIEPNGNFVVMRAGNTKVWESGATPFVSIADVNTIKHRVRINMRGHLVVETSNMFSKLKYQTGLYRQTWSTQPITANVTVGTPRMGSAPYDNYMLVLDDFGRLSLFDAMYVKIWCTADDNGKCGNTKGYKYQEYYQVPTDVPTPDPGLGVVKDPHNSIYQPTSYISGNSIVSKDANCSSEILSGSGMQSPNGRFKVILYATGNMVIKDGTRTMWSSLTAVMPYTTGPYKMLLTDAGELVIQDATRRWMWSSYSNKTAQAVKPFKATILDTGRFVVTDANGLEMWEHWPMNNNNQGYMINGGVRGCLEYCGECGVTVNGTAEVTNTITLPPVTVTTTLATATTTTIAPTNTPAPNPESILNKCKAWMDTYKIDPFVSWGGIEKDTKMQAQWIYYDCACFGTYLKYGVEILRTHLGKWGKLTDTAIRKEYTNSYCNCPLAQDVYKITPNPKNWGSLTDTARQAQWTKDGCDANVNREPFVTNAIGGAPVTPPTWTTLSNITTGIYNNYFTSFTNTTGTTVGVNSTTGADNKVTSMIVTTFLTNATMAVTDSQTISVTTGYTVTTVPVGTTTVPPPTTTTKATATTTTTKVPTPSCTGGKPGVGDGSGTAGQCCKTEADCKDSCNGVMCGVCGTNFTC